MDSGVQPSAGSVGDSYDNALAETINGLYKAEVVQRRSWRTLQALNSRRSNGCTGITTVACSACSGTCRRPKRRKLTIGI
ncbi:TPA: transposase [Burkholderia cepacia]|nr:transposase [Burkholderia cepacia]